MASKQPSVSSRKIEDACASLEDFPRTLKRSERTGRSRNLSIPQTASQVVAHDLSRYGHRCRRLLRRRRAPRHAGIFGATAHSIVPKYKARCSFLARLQIAFRNARRYGPQESQMTMQGRRPSLGPPVSVGRANRACVVCVFTPLSLSAIAQPAEHSLLPTTCSRGLPCLCRQCRRLFRDRRKHDRSAARARR